jgi:hypothetical protein
MKNFEIFFEKFFAAQIAKIIEKKFPESIIETLLEKKGLLKDKVGSLNINLENSTPFVPVIPINIMESIKQVAHLVYYSQSNKAISEIYGCHLNGFFYNEGKAYDYSSVSETGFLINVTALPISSFKINPDCSQNQIGVTIREEIKKIGYIPANHTEAFIIACLTDLLPHGEAFCAINFSWDGFEFAKVFHGRDLKYGLSWTAPSFNKGGCDEKKYNLLIPAYKEFI